MPQEKIKSMASKIYQLVAVINIFIYLYSFYILFPLLGGQSVDSGMQPIAILLITAPTLILTSVIYWLIGIQYKINTLTKTIPLFTALLLCSLIYIDQSSGLVVRIVGSFICIIAFSISVIFNRTDQKEKSSIVLKA